MPPRAPAAVVVPQSPEQLLRAVAGLDARADAALYRLRAGAIDLQQMVASAMAGGNGFDAAVADAERHQKMAASSITAAAAGGGGARKLPVVDVSVEDLANVVGGVVEGLLHSRADAAEGAAAGSRHLRERLRHRQSDLRRLELRVSAQRQEQEQQQHHHYHAAGTAPGSVPHLDQYELSELSEDVAHHKKSRRFLRGGGAIQRLGLFAARLKAHRAERDVLAAQREASAGDAAITRQLDAFQRLLNTIAAGAESSADALEAEGAAYFAAATAVAARAAEIRAAPPSLPSRLWAAIVGSKAAEAARTQEGEHHHASLFLRQIRLYQEMLHEKVQALRAGVHGYKVVMESLVGAGLDNVPVAAASSP
jgi:hypothetical protein